ncbi:MAG TPA: efflux RND transporter periplasmic adaptor subunit [Bacteroidota bacterium]|nr:efflux RND transporter periplasmic adaptor subunit [Bacteroidota bacterium]
MKNKFIVLRRWLIFFAGTMFLIMNGCKEPQGTDRTKAVSATAAVIENGITITFPPGSPGLEQIGVVPAKKGSAFISVLAPSRVVANIIPTASGTDRAVLFDSPDVTSLYSQYRQAKINVERTSKNLARTKEMYNNQASTGKDLNDAETDAATAKAQFNEADGKLCALGYSPQELDNISIPAVLLIADVTESQLKDVREGEAVDISFTSLPDKKILGRTEAIGNVIDPVTRTVKVRVSAKNLNGFFLPGMYAKIKFGDPISNAILLPPSAVVTVEGKDYVFVQASAGVFHRQDVTILDSNPATIVVGSGVKDGDRIVVQGALLLKGLSFGY